MKRQTRNEQVIGCHLTRVCARAIQLPSCGMVNDDLDEVRALKSSTKNGHSTGLGFILCRTETEGKGAGYLFCSP